LVSADTQGEIGQCHGPADILDIQRGAEMYGVITAQPMGCGEVHCPLGYWRRHFQDEIVLPPVLAKGLDPMNHVGGCYATHTRLTEDRGHKLHGAYPHHVEIMALDRVRQYADP